MSNINDQKDDQSFGNNSKKRKLSMAGNSLSNVQLKVLQFENQTLKQLVQEFENENEFNELKSKIIELEETVAKLQKENSDMQKKNEAEKNQFENKIDELNSASVNCGERLKTVENEKKEMESKIKELNVEILSLKNIKSEIKNSADNEKTNFQDSICKLNAELKNLKNKNSTLEKVNQNLKNLHEKEIETMKKQKEESGKRIKDLEYDLQYAKDFKIIIERKVEEERKSFQLKTDKMKAELKDLKIKMSKSNK